MRAHSGRTHPFEAVKNLAEELRWKFGGSVTVHNLAVSSRSGRESLEIPIVRVRNPTGLSPPCRSALWAGVEIETQDVELCRLDDVPLGDIGVTKIDVEGPEGTVLKGAIATIERCRPNILVEAGGVSFARHDRSHRGFFASRRYSGCFLLHEELRPFRDFDRATMQNPTDYPELGSPIRRQKRHYVNDFMLLPDETAGSTCNKRIKTLPAMDAIA